LFGSLRQEKIGSCVAFVLEPRRKADKRKLDSELHTILLVVFIHFYLHPTSPTPNGRTMANDSVLHAQQQWQWDH
jgi:hypothetical protein